MIEFEKIKNSHMLNNTAFDVIHLIKSFKKKYNLKKEVKIHMVNDSLQMIDKDTCGMYQLYFYVNLFHPLKNSLIINEKNEK